MSTKSDEVSEHVRLARYIRYYWGSPQLDLDGLLLKLILERDELRAKLIQANNSLLTSNTKALELREALFNWKKHFQSTNTDPETEGESFTDCWFAMEKALQ
jgi:hypothetical protein